MSCGRGSSMHSVIGFCVLFLAGAVSGILGSSPYQSKGRLPEVRAQYCPTDTPGTPSHHLQMELWTALTSALFDPHFGGGGCMDGGSTGLCEHWVCSPLRLAPRKTSFC